MHPSSKHLSIWPFDHLAICLPPNIISVQAFANILALTSQEFAHAARRAVHDGTTGALRGYSAFFRTGQWSLPAPAPHVAPIDQVLASESPEGTVIKFTQRVPKDLAGTPTAKTINLTIAGQAPTATTPATTTTLETESVLIPMMGKSNTRSYTLCLSSQVGCAMGCAFCQTAQMGLVRSLTAQEIVQQWFAAEHLLTRPDAGAPIRNIVFMGMGEPLDNFDAVAQAIYVLTDRRGPNIASSRITISTVGRIDGLAKLRGLILTPGYHRLGLAVSVNAPSDDIRSGIMPINRPMPMHKLRDAIADWPRHGSGHIMLEYVLIPGVNDLDEHARELANWIQGDADAPLRCCVNVIPYNPRQDSPWPAPDEETVERFITTLASTGVYVKRRRTKGRDQMAACGQLGNLEYRRKKAQA